MSTDISPRPGAAPGNVSAALGRSPVCQAVTSGRPTAGQRTAIPCRADDPDLWFAESPAQLEQAKELCASCPIRQLCLSAALDRAEPWGVWGGEIFEQGVVIARKRPRGRPRKQPVCA